MVFMLSCVCWACSNVLVLWFLLEAKSVSCGVGSPNCLVGILVKMKSLGAKTFAINLGFYRSFDLVLGLLWSWNLRRLRSGSVFGVLAISIAYFSYHLGALVFGFGSFYILFLVPRSSSICFSEFEPLKNQSKKMHIIYNQECLKLYQWR